MGAWVRQLAEQAGGVHLLFNNNAQDYAIQNARQLALLLGKRWGWMCAGGGVSAGAHK
jgi:uncharacterized protein YecE (DUF72 family)